MSKPRYPSIIQLLGLLSMVGVILTTACGNTQIQPTDRAATFAATAAVRNAPATLAPPTVSPTPQPEETTITQPVASSETPALPAPTAAPAAKPAENLPADFWQALPIIPEIDPSMKEVYQRGLALSHNPKAFSKIGDCGSSPSWFLGDFDRGPKYYNLGAYQNLEGVIAQFQGSYGRTSLAARRGFNASSVFTPLWSDQEQCQSNETPLACEFRVHQPVIVFVMLGSNDVWHPEKFEPQMRAILEYSLQMGVIPILSTKADNEEKDHSINNTIARLAIEYKAPLWNFWRAVQDLPDKGLQEDGVHLTWAANRFNDEQAMKKAWPVHNLTALQTLDAVWRSITSGE